MEASLVYNRCVTLPDAYEAQLMVMQDTQGGPRSGQRGMIYRARVWIGTACEREPLLHWSQEHGDAALAIGACYAMLAAGAQRVAASPAVLEAVLGLVNGQPAAAAG